MLAIEKLEISHSWKYKNDETAVKAHQKWTKIDEKTMMKNFSSSTYEKTLMKH